VLRHQSKYEEAEQTSGRLLEGREKVHGMVQLGLGKCHADFDMVTTPTHRPDTDQSLHHTETTEASMGNKTSQRAALPAYLEQKVFRWSTQILESAWEWNVIGNVDEYIALSHTWGDGPSLLETTIAGIEMQVSTWKRDNLAQWIQQKLPDTWIWMDILCIPQRGDQRLVATCLQCVPQIFHTATCVHVLLEDQAPLLAIPTYDEFDEDYACQNEAYGTIAPKACRLPIMELVKQWAIKNEISLPNSAWMQRFWTRQEAQYTSQICFHGVGPIKDHHDSRPQVQTEPLGLMGQLPSSMVMLEHDVMCKIFIELIAARGTPIAGLVGRERQRAGGLVLALRELRAARRATKKSQDYVLALFPTFDWYDVPELARTRSTFDLLSDALCQFERSNNRVVLRPTMDGIFSYGQPQSRTE